MNYSMKAFALMNSERDGEKQNEGWEGGGSKSITHLCAKMGLYDNIIYLRLWGSR